MRILLFPFLYAVRSHLVLLFSSIIYAVRSNVPVSSPVLHAVHSHVRVFLSQFLYAVRSHLVSMLSSIIYAVRFHV
jgi:hypothetical protein